MEKPWTYVETRTKIKGTNEKYKIKVDLEDLVLLKNRAVYIQCSKYSILAKQVLYKEIVGGEIIDSKALTLSRLIMGLYNSPAPFVIKNINNDLLDLRKSNLKVISQTEMQLRSKNYKKGSNLPKGVFITKDGYIFSAIKINKKNTYLGSYDTIEEASKAYEDARKELLKALESVNLND